MDSEKLSNISKKKEWKKSNKDLSPDLEVYILFLDILAMHMSTL
jgi:hypothetical protein